ncbi:hypothetical protein AB0B71_28580 [Micromonospora echinofusca]|uniref:hypothetical protein n=1 Tax=Micromonospora echinofusca TaxID=47858 RepID=UPI0033E0BCDE
MDEDHGQSPVLASRVVERVQISLGLIDRDESISQVVIALLDLVRINSSSARLLAQRGQVDFVSQGLGDRSGVSGLQLDGGLLLATLVEEPRAGDTADDAYATDCASSKIEKDWRDRHGRTSHAAARTG